jgi:hypothetical protein
MVLTFNKYKPGRKNLGFFVYGPQSKGVLENHFFMPIEGLRSPIQTAIFALCTFAKTGMILCQN